MKLKLLTALALIMGIKAGAQNLTVQLFPRNNGMSVNPDTHLVITFASTPTLGTSGMIRIYDAATKKLVDSLDLSIPAGPTKRDTSKAPVMVTTPYEYAKGHFTNANTKPGTPSGGAVPTSDKYQLTIIGGFTDAFHFYPVIIHDKVATIYPHNNLLDYNKTYYVTIDPGVLTLADNSFKGIGRGAWKFTTKPRAPLLTKSPLVVSDDGTGDFNTVQGALDFVPDTHAQRVTIFVKSGTYEEIVYFRKKNRINIIGQDRAKTIVTYANMEPFNPHPVNRGTNEVPGTYPSRRAAFMADNCDDICIANISIINPTVNQSEGLLMTGEHNMVYQAYVKGGGDGLQVNGSAYFKDCNFDLSGDAILGRGAAFFDNCDFRSPGPFMWVRSTQASHGDVFINSTFHGVAAGRPADFAREPLNGGKTYPYTEAVLINSKLENISPAGWGKIDGPTENIHFWEYNSHNLADGKPADVSQRHPVSKQLTMDKDAETIKNYSNPAFVLGGWEPPLAELKAEMAKVLK